MAGTTTNFIAAPQAAEPFSVHLNLTTMAGHPTGDEILPCGLGGGFGINFNTTATATSAVTSPIVICERQMDCAAGDGGNNIRWPRQETLALLQIRSRLNSMFKEANQKGPLWDEVSRIMVEKHGYHRSGKKCREKFDNLYKYYKKTKERNSGRHDGKDYQFFRHLEALYGETSVSPAPSSQTNFTNSSEFEISSPEKHDDDLSAIAFSRNHSMEKKKSTRNESQGCSKRAKRNWKARIKGFIEPHMRKLMETQEAWMEKISKTIERNEQERMFREEEWRKQQAARFDEECRFWVNERAWAEDRDGALIEALKKLTGNEVEKLKRLSWKEILDSKTEDMSAGQISDRWSEPEISCLIQLRTSMESRIRETGCTKDGLLWDDIAAKMASFGYGQSGISFSSSNTYFQHLQCYDHGHHSIAGQGLQQIMGDLIPSSSNMDTAVQDSCCFGISLMDEGECLLENYAARDLIIKGKPASLEQERQNFSCPFRG